MELKELRKSIREDLKKLGLKRGDFSLSIRESGCADTYIKVEIKNPYINANEIEKELLKYEKVDRDMRSYEILQGCNTFVMVYYEYGVFDKVAKEYETEATEIWNKVLYGKGDNVLVQNNDKTYEMGLFKEKGRNAIMSFHGKVGKNDYEKRITIYSVNELSKCFFQLYNTNAIV